MGKAKLTVRTTDLGSVIIDCGDKHYNTGARVGSCMVLSNATYPA